MSLERPTLQSHIANCITLLPTASGQPGGTFPSTNTVLVGNHTACEVCSDHPGLSQRHAMFVCQTDGRWWVHDLRSRRGVKVNGRRVASMFLRDGDRVELGDLVWRVELPNPGKGKSRKGTENPLREFSVLSVLHKGEQGKVYRALWKRKRREVALRTFPIGFASDRAAVQRMKQRLSLAASIHHENVVRLYTGGRFPDRSGKKRWFLASEYMPGGSLRDWLQKHPQPLPLSDTVKLALDIATGLLAAEDVGLRHRNVNPACILYNADGRAKLGDFLHARTESEGGDPTRGDVSKHTLVYQAPERILGQGDPTPAADLYSLAVCLYEATTRRLPWSIEDRSVLEVVQSIREEQPPSPLEFNTSLLPKLADLILDTMAKDPARRPANAGEFLKRLAMVVR